MDTQRTFIALPLTQEIHDALREVQNELRQEVSKVRWTRPEGVHITLKFLGDTDSSVVDQLIPALDEVASGHHPFELKLNGTGAFPRLANPRVLWVGLETSEELLALQHDVEEAIAPFGFEKEKRKFKAHLTLARLQGDLWPEGHRRLLLDARKTIDGLILPVKELILFRSDLKPDGAVYTALHRAKL
ncbi:RNA 2',3'-cyclic phosphodiesterase [bacterium]|nr:RNA 2',3'-cyclic phosphodiesterase [bacterium]MBU1636517.1 RNA 2',3'-cyclic phosphodiesterase [bacterium]MBU1880480.1 RNA 2',3'-cyclic phosphodiesterase [bacterium]